MFDVDSQIVQKSLICKDDLWGKNCLLKTYTNIRYSVQSFIAEVDCQMLGDTDLQKKNAEK